MSLTLAIQQITAPNWWNNHPATLIKPPCAGSTQRMKDAADKRKILRKALKEIGEPVPLDSLVEYVGMTKSSVMHNLEILAKEGTAEKTSKKVEKRICVFWGAL
jgi:hypothetical protein